MCFERFAKVDQELEVKDWLKVVDEIKTFSPRIHISGGEPFVFKDIIRVIEHIKKNNLYLNITTNGTFLEEYTEELIKSRVDRIDISIDGPEEIHNRIRGVPGTFGKVLRGLKMIKGSRRDLPLIKINSIINFANPETMEEIVEFAQTNGASIIQFIYPLYLEKDAVVSHKNLLHNTLNRDINYWSEANHYKPESGDFCRIQSVMKKIKEKKVIIDIFPKFNAEQFDAYYKNPKRFSEIYEGRCRAMWNTLTILPDGSIESCPDYVVGNVKTQRILPAWNSQKMVFLRKIIRDKRSFSVCRACCFFYQ